MPRFVAFGYYLSIIEEMWPIWRILVQTQTSSEPKRLLPATM